MLTFQNLREPTLESSSTLFIYSCNDRNPSIIATIIFVQICELMVCLSTELYATYSTFTKLTSFLNMIDFRIREHLKLEVETWN